MPISTQDAEPNIDIVVQITEPYERPTAPTVLVFRCDGLDIPWPEGMTVREALLFWKYKVDGATVQDGKVVVPKTVKSHWSDCPTCYDYHENHHICTTGSYEDHEKATRCPDCHDYHEREHPRTWEEHCEEDIEPTQHKDFRRVV